MALVSTLLQPPDIQQAGVSWWYLAPRNGHVSLHSEGSFARLAQQHGLQLASSPNRSMHLLYRTVPAFAGHLGVPRT